MAIWMETPRRRRLLGSRVRPAGSLPLQLGECSQAGWVPSLKIYVGFIEDEPAVLGELLLIFLDMAPLHTPGLRLGWGQLHAPLHRHRGNLDRVRGRHCIRSSEGGPLAEGYAGHDALCGIQAGRPVALFDIAPTRLGKPHLYDVGVAKRYGRLQAAAASCYIECVLPPGIVFEGTSLRKPDSDTLGLSVLGLGFLAH